MGGARNSALREIGRIREPRNRRAESSRRRIPRGRISQPAESSRAESRGTAGNAGAPRNPCPRQSTGTNVPARGIYAGPHILPRTGLFWGVQNPASWSRVLPGVPRRTKRLRVAESLCPRNPSRVRIAQYHEAGTEPRYLPHRSASRAIGTIDTRASPECQWTRGRTCRSRPAPRMNAAEPAGLAGSRVQLW